MPRAVTLSRVVGIALVVALALVSCAGRRAKPAAVARDLDAVALLDRKCTTCHDLGGLSAYAEYWGEPEWRSMVETMIGYGAQLSPEEITMLSRYLAIRYGTGAKSANDS